MKSREKSRAFTLVEVLGVIVILSVIALIVYPVISSNIAKGKQEAYDVNINAIKKAAENWLEQYSGNVPDEDFTVYLLDLKTKGLIDKDITNPITGKKFPDDMEILMIYGENEIHVPQVDPTTGTENTDDYSEDKVIIMIKSTKVEYIEINSEYFVQYRDDDISAIYSNGTAIDPKEIKISYQQYKNGVKTDVSGTLSSMTDLSNPPKVEADTSDFYTYVITYEVNNGEGVISTATRKVIVRDTTPPKLDIPTNQKISKNQTEFNIFNGVTYSDNSCDKKGSEQSEIDTCNENNVKVTTYGNVTLGQVGEYTITYIATDPSGNTTKKTRTITIVDEKCPTVKITGTTESGKLTYNEKVTLTASLSKDVEYSDTTKLQWQRCTDGTCVDIEGANDKTYVVQDYYENEFQVVLYKDGLVCSSDTYATNISLPKFECEIQNLPTTWVSSADLTVSSKIITEGLQYQIDGGDWSTENQFTVNQYRDYVVNAKNSYNQEATCSAKPLIDNEAPNITVKLYKLGTSTLVEEKTNADISKDWVNYQYRIEIDASDGQSGIKTFTINDNEVSGTYYAYDVPEGTRTFVAKVVDNVGLERTVTVVLKSDITKPICGTSDGSAAWQNGNKRITIGCSDTLSQCTQNSYYKDFTTDSQTGIIQIADNAGNTSDCTVQVYVDKTAPTCTLRVTSGTAGSNGWYRSNVTIAFNTTSDDLSGVKSYNFSNGSTTYTVGETASTTVTGYVYDNAGNQGTCSITVKVDKTAPTCTTTTTASGWTNQNVVLTGTCADSTSKCTGNASKTITTESSGTAYSPGTVSDYAGNSVACASKAVYIDKTAPTCAWNTATAVNGNALASNTLSDTRSGVAYYGVNQTNASYPSWNYLGAGASTTISYTPAANCSAQGYYLWAYDYAGNVGNCYKSFLASNLYSSNGLYYNELVSAFSGTASGGTVTTKCNYTDSNAVTVSGKTLTLNLQHTLTKKSTTEIAMNIASGGTLNVVGSGTYKMSGDYRPFAVYGTLNVGTTSTTFSGTIQKTKAGYACIKVYGGTVNYRSGNLVCNAEGISLQDGYKGTANVTGGYLKVTKKQVLVCGFSGNGDDATVKNNLNFTGGKVCNAGTWEAIYVYKKECNVKITVPAASIMYEGSGVGIKGMSYSVTQVSSCP